MLTQELEIILNDQIPAFQQRDPGTLRRMDLQPYLRTPRIVAIIGVRRCGKSTLLRQIADRLPSYHYINFDDERLADFVLADFQHLMVAWQKRGRAATVLLDEIQNVTGWERFVRRLQDENYKVFLTGSNAKLLGSELATHLTGRCDAIRLHPFSFSEFLAFRNCPFPPRATPAIAQVLGHFDQYLTMGGFPEYVKYQNPEILKNTYDGILYRDLIGRFRIRQTKTFRDLAHYLFTNFTQKISYHSLQKISQQATAMSIRNHIGHMQDAQLLFEHFRYDPSLKRQHLHDKKVYVIDNGMRHVTVLTTSEDRGRYLENLVYIEIQRRGGESFYFQGKNECDFVVRRGRKTVEVIQVTWEIKSHNLQREINGLKEAMQALQVSMGTMITYDQQKGQTPIRDRHIHILPAWQWLTRN